jgi:hypothetical protein
MRATLMVGRRPKRGPGGAVLIADPVSRSVPLGEALEVAAEHVLHAGQRTGAVTTDG